MSLVRRQILPLFCIAAALAVGIALGAGPLQGGSANGADDLASENSALADQVSALKAAATFNESATAGALPGWVSGRLQGRDVTLVVFPGVSDDRVDAVRAAVKAASASTAATVHLSADLLDPGRKTYVSSVAHSSLRGVHDIDAAESDDPYAQLGGLLARAYVGTGDVPTADEESTKIASELVGAKLVTVDGELARHGTLTIVLGTSEHGSDVSTQASHLIATALVDALVERSAGSVVVTPPTGSDPGGLLDALSENPPSGKAAWSTLNVSDGSAAQIATVTALAAALNGKAGQFGVVDGAVVLPPGMPAPASP